MTLNEWDDAEQQSRESADHYSLEKYVVEKIISSGRRTTKEDSDAGEPLSAIGTVTAKPLRGKTQSADEYDGTEQVEVLVPHAGDAVDLERGQIIVVGFDMHDTPIMLGVSQHYQDVPEQETGERVIGHNTSGTEIRFKSDGSVVVDAGTDVTIKDDVTAENKVTVEGDAVVEGSVDLGGTGGAAVARKGDAVSNGTIDEGSSKVNAVD
jgi:hypothetical protein